MAVMGNPIPPSTLLIRPLSWSSTYVFGRSDGAVDRATKTLTFNTAGRLPVRTTWKLGAPGSSYSGWQTIRVLAPNAIESSRATFTLRCQ